MPTVQDTYNETIAVGFPGMVASGERDNRISRTIEDAAGIAFGKAVFRGSGDHGVTATPAAGTCLGILIADHGQPVIPGGVAADIVPQYQTGSILAMGAIWVTVGADVTDGAAVYVGDGDPLTAGAFTDDATGNIALTGWVFDMTVASGGLCRIVKR